MPLAVGGMGKRRGRGGRRGVSTTKTFSGWIVFSIEQIEHWNTVVIYFYLLLFTTLLFTSILVLLLSAVNGYRRLLRFTLFHFAYSVPKLLLPDSLHTDTMLLTTRYHITNESQVRRRYSVLFWA